jgi:di/tripeptidase
MRLVRAAAARAGRSIESAGMGGGCDANILNHRGFEVVNLGTGCARSTRRTSGSR